MSDDRHVMKRCGFHATSKLPFQRGSVLGAGYALKPSSSAQPSPASPAQSSRSRAVGLTKALPDVFF